ncbi:hypothetical protein Q8F55_003724 [Vanrija albida]|uniref:DNA replication regulator Sld3 C-terminal domain-containing protein n=1 Tax=Vanrija albida TaxID=181172 RepID=A0ABR3Q5A7_9TREE
MTAAALVDLPQEIPLAQPRALPQLPHTLDLSCPVPLPTNKARVPWPWPVASVPDEKLDAFIARRYYETLYLGDTLAPLSGFAADLERVLPTDTGAALVPHLLALGDIETRHRKTLAPAINAALQPGGEEAVSAERQALALGVDLRSKSRAAVEGGRVPRAKTLTEEFEHREEGKRVVEESVTEKEGKKDRKKRKLGPVEPPHPSKDPGLALENLADRVSVWQVMSQLDLGGLGLSDTPKPDPAGGMAAIIKRFWTDVLVPFFIQKQHSFCASFHLKVFGAELPAELVQKKPRKPKVTRKLSLDARDDEPASAAANPPAKLRRTVSHAPHTSTRRPSSPERGRDASHQPHRERTVQRSMSRVSDRTDRSRTVDGDLASRRSRSSSIDPVPVNRPKPSIVRAPSGKDLFKGREVGLLRRSNSVRLPQAESQSQSQGQSQVGRGLFGRRTNSTQLPAPSQSQSQSQASSETLVLATPAKPKHSAFFARAHTQQWHPTPIREEPSSAERSYSYVAETPGRRSANGSLVAETPRGSAHSRVAETPAHGSHGGHSVSETPLGRVAGTPLRGTEIDYDDDDLGALMVPTDEEDEVDDDDHDHGFGGLLAPETPRKAWQ